ncbi:MAG: N-acetylglucosamine-6-phosphate deacetylase [Pseudomonadota bacterium]|nr:N-acetylglucosamine-6-phosphate deacetylase [Pseudomonadota bacterium]
MTLALTNLRLFDGESLQDGLHVILDNGRIATITDTVPADMAREDCGGHLLAPGFVDLQVNGGGDVLFNDSPTVESLQTIAAAHCRFGTTSLLPTLVTDAPDKRRKAVDAVRQAMGQVPGVRGIHLEGPWISPKRKGAHDATLMATPSEEDMALLDSLPGTSMVTVAPDCISPALIRRMADRSIRVSLGHSDASHAQAQEALKAGAVAFTHLYNTMSPLHHREPGMVGAALDSEAWCGIIADGHHVHPAAIRIAWKTKPPGTLFLVTDAMPPVGGTQTSFTLYGQQIRVHDGKCTTPEGILAGSALDMASAVRYCVNTVGIPLSEALRMASLYPATLMGWHDRIGRIVPGYEAALVLLDSDLRAIKTWAGGSRNLYTET